MSFFSGLNQQPQQSSSGPNQSLISSGSSSGSSFINLFGGGNNNTNNNKGQINSGISFGNNQQQQPQQQQQGGNYFGFNLNSNQNNNQNNQSQNQQNNNPINLNQQNQPNQQNQQNQNQQLSFNSYKDQIDLQEFCQILKNVESCINPYSDCNMFKDYVYKRLPKNQIQNIAIFSQYRPFLLNRGQKIKNDYNIWEEARKNNKNPQELYPFQISNVEGILNRSKLLEISLLKNLDDNILTGKSMDNLNIKIDDSLGGNFEDFKNSQTQLNELGIKISSKVAQINNLLRGGNENLDSMEKIKEAIKKANNDIKESNMEEMCEKISKIEKENINGENKNYIKEMSKDRVNNILDVLMEIQNMMKVIDNNTKKNLIIVKGMEKEVERIKNKGNFYENFGY